MYNTVTIQYDKFQLQNNLTNCFKLAWTTFASYYLSTFAEKHWPRLLVTLLIRLLNSLCKFFLPGWGCHWWYWLCDVPPSVMWRVTFATQSQSAIDACVCYAFSVIYWYYHLRLHLRHNSSLYLNCTWISLILTRKPETSEQACQSPHDQITSCLHEPG